MLWTIGDLPGYEVRARDGTAGHVHDLYFEDRGWRVRYLVVQLGSWLHDRRVLLAPGAVDVRDPRERTLSVAMTREEVEACEPARAAPTVSVEKERRYRNYVTWPALWLSAYAMNPADGALPPDVEWPHDAEPEDGDCHLRSAAAITGYSVLATDRPIGRVHDFALTDDWRIEDLVVETGTWPHHETVMVAPYWVERVSWEMSSVVLSISSEAAFSRARMRADGGKRAIRVKRSRSYS
jgi:uncharacterized protein YrrD